MAYTCKGIDLVFKEGRIGETYNLGGKNERTNLYIATTICVLLDELKPSKFNNELFSFKGC